MLRNIITSLTLTAGLVGFLGCGEGGFDYAIHSNSESVTLYKGHGIYELKPKWKVPGPVYRFDTEADTTLFWRYSGEIEFIDLNTGEKAKVKSKNTNLPYECNLVKLSDKK